MVIQGLPGDPRGRRGGEGGILEFRVRSWGLWSVPGGVTARTHCLRVILVVMISMEWWRD